MFDWKNIIRGMMMGITEVIPGVSSSTIAMILGIYERFITALSGLTTREWKTHLGFLIPLGIGMVLALLGFARLIEWLLLEYTQPTLLFLLGLIIGVVPSLLKTVQFRQTFKARHYLLLVFAGLLVASTSLFQENEAAAVMTNLTGSDYMLLFISGWIASSLMILPGISGALIFLLFGVYPTVVNALHTLNFSVLFVVGSGIMLGVFITSKLIRYLFSRYTIGTYAVMVGLILGSTVVIYQYVPKDGSFWFISLLTFLAGLIVAISLGRIRHR